MKKLLSISLASLCLFLPGMYAADASVDYQTQEQTAAPKEQGRTYQGKPINAGTVDDPAPPAPQSWEKELGNGCVQCCCYKPCYTYTCECEVCPKYVQRKCCRQVPQYYQVQRCRYVPEYYYETQCRQCSESYYVTDCMECPKYTYHRQCSWVPQYSYYKCCLEPCAAPCEPACAETTTACQ